MARGTILDSFNRGDLAQAYDLCLRELDAEPGNVWLQHRAVLCLIRSGALQRAEAEYARLGLDRAPASEDILALQARLLKARALEADPSAFTALALRSSERYEAAFAQTGGYYSGINAATMARLAGRASQAQALACRVMQACDAAEPASAEEAYYTLSTRAEAFLLLGNQDAAAKAIAEAIAQDPENYLAHATSLRQFRLLLSVLNQSDNWLEEFEPPRPAYFAGHIFGIGAGEGCLSSMGETDLARAIDAALAANKVGALYGALAAGSDILIAEAGLRRGAELHLVLPVSREQFIADSVRPLGEDWVHRFEACVAPCDSLVEVTSDRVQVSPLNLGFASRVAMGQARIRADYLSTQPVQILVARPDAVAGSFGTLHDGEIWRASGLQQCVIPLDPAVRYCPPDTSGGTTTDRFERVLRAMIFADVRGSTQVPDDRVPDFVEQVLGGLAQVCDGLEVGADYADSWGDGLFLAFEHVDHAAAAAVKLMTFFQSLDLAALGLPETLSLRVGAHCGPVFKGQDQVQQRASLFGGQVAMAARIEQSALPGSIFASEPFAAALAMSAPDRFRCEYVGQTRIDPLMPEKPLYSLRPIQPGSLVARAAGH